MREVSPADIPDQSWVNDHLVYTHGYGAVVSPANTAVSSGSGGVNGTGGQPSFVIGSVPTQSTGGAPPVKQPEVYFGVGQSGYVVANTKQAEVDYVKNSGSVYSHYGGDGGIQMGSFWTRAAFALRFHDLNLLISKLITPQSRIMFLQDVRARVAKVAPYLHVDGNPYPVVDNGQVVWMVDAYTTTSYYPYAQQATTSVLPSGSGLDGTYNYVRNSVKVVVNAWTGNMTFYAVNDTDPILQSWETVFPGMYKPLSQMDSTLQAHLRYPQDLMMLQSSMYGRYHLTNASSFYTGNNAWQLAPISGNGSPASPPPTDAFGNTLPFVPQYEIIQVPGEQSASFKLVEPLDPQSANNSNQTLAALHDRLERPGHLRRAEGPRHPAGGERERPGHRELSHPGERPGVAQHHIAQLERLERRARHHAHHPDRGLAVVRASAVRHRELERLSGAQLRDRRLRRQGLDGVHPRRRPRRGLRAVDRQHRQRWQWRDPRGGARPARRARRSPTPQGWRRSRRATSPPTTTT